MLSYAGQTSVVQVLPPLHFADSCLAHKSARRMNRHAAWLAEQFHACFRRHPVSFAHIAVTAGSNQVFPRTHSASRARNHVLEFQFAAQTPLSPQYWQVCPSRMRMFFLDSVWIRDGKR